MPFAIVSDPALLARLAVAARHPAKGRQLRSQRVSFIYGSLPKDSTITREQIEKTLDRNEA